MTCQAAIPLDVRVRVLADRPDDSAAQVASDVAVGSPSSLDDLERFAKDCDVVTFDHELVPPGHLRALDGGGAVLRPGADTMRFAQDKAHQRARFAAAGLPVPDFTPVASTAGIRRFGDERGFPLMLKAATGGYDGRGVWTIEDHGTVDDRWREAGAGRVPLLVEEAVALERELAVLLARRPSGEAAVYPLIETVQSGGICTELRVPAAVPAAVAADATDLGLRVATAVDAVGILAVELFWTGHDLLVNEVATRPHNSGHWTIEGAVTSQFANHLRAVLDWPLGDAAARAPAVATVNILGPADGSEPRGRLPEALRVPGAAVHLYGKRARPGRKLGHVTALGDDPTETRDRARQAAAMLVGNSR